MFDAKILTKIYAKLSQTLCPTVSKMSSKTMFTILNISNDEVILKMYER